MIEKEIQKGELTKVENDGIIKIVGECVKKLFIGILSSFWAISAKAESVFEKFC